MYEILQQLPIEQATQMNFLVPIVLIGMGNILRKVRVERDKGQCMATFRHNCNMGTKPTTHHIVPRSEFDMTDHDDQQAVSDPNNLIAMCENAQKMLHSNPSLMRRVTPLLKNVAQVRTAQFFHKPKP